MKKAQKLPKDKKIPKDKTKKIHEKRTKDKSKKQHSMKKFENMNIKQKLNSGYTIVIVLMIISGVVSMISLGILKSSLNSFINGSNKADTAVKMCQIDVNTAARAIREMALITDTSTYPEYIATVEESLADVTTELEMLKSTGLIDDELYSRYETALTEWGEIGNECISQINSNNREGAARQIIAQCTPALDEVVALSNEIDAITKDLMAQSEMMSQIAFFASIAILILFILIAVLVAIQISKKIISAITVPLAEIETVSKELTKGNLHTNIEYNANDEIGSLANSLRESFGILSSYVDDISKSMNEFATGNFVVQPKVEWRGDFVGILDAFKSFEKSMAATIRGIQMVADQVKGGSEQVSESSMGLAQGATEQASTTEELAATIESVADQVSANAENAKAISKEVEKVGVEIVHGNEKMTEMVQSMVEINESSQQIGKIIATINDIADQTNLLALNASIEAARAGEAGKGFAVVADQVAVLAAQSADAARESTLLIDASVKAVEKGIDVADETAKQLEQVVAGSKLITEEVNKIVQALEAQSVSFEQINEGVDHINDVVQTNAATSEECAAASQEMSSQAGMLETEIRRFQIAESEEA